MSKYTVTTLPKSKAILILPAAECQCCHKKHYIVSEDQYEFYNPGDDDPFIGYYWNCECGSTLFRKKTETHEITNTEKT